MSRSTERYVRIDKGIYAVYDGRTKVALRANVRVNGQLIHSPRFGPHTAIRTVKAWQDAARVGARQAPVVTRVASPDGFAGDAQQYLQAVSAMASYDDRKRDIEHWVRLFGTRPRSRITRADVQAALAAWAKKLAPSTVNHRRTALLHLWRTLDGKGAENPVAETTKYREPEPENRSLDYDTIERIFAAMDDTVTKARLMVIAYTGLPHIQIARLTPKHIDLEAGTLTPPVRRKGGGSKRETLPLSAKGRMALEALIRHDAVGKAFSNSSLHSSFRRACDKVQADTGIDLSGAKPYDLRHSFGARLYEATGDERAVQKMLQHARIETTHRYTLGGVDARLKAAVAAFDAASVEPSGELGPPAQHTGD